MTPRDSGSMTAAPPGRHLPMLHGAEEFRDTGERKSAARRGAQPGGGMPCARMEDEARGAALETTEASTHRRSKQRVGRDVPAVERDFPQVRRSVLCFTARAPGGLGPAGRPAACRRTPSSIAHGNRETSDTTTTTDRSRRNRRQAVQRTCSDLRSEAPTTALEHRRRLRLSPRRHTSRIPVEGSEQRCEDEDQSDADEGDCSNYEERHHPRRKSGRVARVARAILDFRCQRFPPPRASPRRPNFLRRGAKQVTR